VATVVIVVVLLAAMVSIGAIVLIGLFRSRRTIRWKTPGYNVFTGRWSDEQDPGDDSGR
jgi:hypothetical protein